MWWRSTIESSTALPARKILQRPSTALSARRLFGQPHRTRVTAPAIATKTALPAAEALNESCNDSEHTETGPEEHAQESTAQVSGVVERGVKPEDSAASSVDKTTDVPQEAVASKKKPLTRATRKHLRKAAESAAPPAPAAPEDGVMSRYHAIRVRVRV